MQTTKEKTINIIMNFICIFECLCVVAYFILYEKMLIAYFIKIVVY